MRNWLRTGGILLAVGLVVVVSRSWSAPKAEPPARRTRVAVLNVSQVIKSYAKWKTFQAHFKKDVERYEEEAKELKAQVDSLAKDSTAADAPAAQREQAEEKLKEAKRALEDLAAKAKKSLAEKQAKQYTELYGDVRHAVAKYAKAHDLELVLQYNDMFADSPEGDKNPLGIQRRLTTDGCLPLYAADGMDISKDIIFAMGQH